MSRLCPDVWWSCPVVSLCARVRWCTVSQPSLVTILICIARQKPCRVLCRTRCCAYRSTPTPCRRALGVVLQSCRTLCSDTRSPPQPLYKILYRNPPLARPRARGRPCRSSSWPYRRVPGRRVAVPGRRVAVCPAALCHDTICCIVT